MNSVAKLNELEIPAPLDVLMRRNDWAGKRTHDAWLSRFGYPSSEFVEFCGLDHLQRENRNIRSLELRLLCGAPNAECPPGDFEPTRGFLIGFTDLADDAICVDFRPTAGPSIIYYSPQTDGFVTAFETLESFKAYYESVHGA